MPAMMRSCISRAVDFYLSLSTTPQTGRSDVPCILLSSFYSCACERELNDEKKGGGTTRVHKKQGDKQKGRQSIRGQPVGRIQTGKKMKKRKL